MSMYAGVPCEVGGLVHRPLRDGERENRITSSGMLAERCIVGTLLKEMQILMLLVW